MSSFILSPFAEEDLEAIYTYTALNHGLDQLDIYAAQIDAAIEEIAEDPMRPRSRARDDLFTGCRFYPVEHHFLVYRVKHGCVEVGRVLHEAMNFPAHVSDSSNFCDG
jgi:toxin ParE1/3/4